MTAMAVVATAIGVATVAVKVFKELMEFGAEGAEVINVESAFSTLMDTVGVGPSVMEDLQVATQNTVTDLDLMASSTKLLTGTTGGLQQALGQNLPQLWEIANAASDMNPKLGTAADMFDKMTSAIQSGRGTSLAQIGLAIKMSDAYDAFGESIGKTGSELTKEEQQMALLNAVLKEGADVVRQAALVNDQAADSIARMETSLENLANTAKAKAAPAIAAVADSLFFMIEGYEGAISASRGAASSILASSTTFKDYQRQVQAVAASMGAVVNSSGDIVKAGRVVASNFAFTEQAAWAAAKSLQAMEAATGELSGGLSALNEDVVPAAIDAADELAKMWGERYAEGVTAATGSTFEMVEALRLQIVSAGLAAGLSGELTQAMEEYSVTMGDLALEHTELTEQLAELAARGYPETSKAVQELTAALLENEAAQMEAATGLDRTTAALIYNQASAGLNTQAALDLARSMGVLNEQDYVLGTTLETIRQSFDTNADSILSASEAGQDYVTAIGMVNRAVANLQSANMPITFENIATEMQKVADSGAAGELQGTASAAQEGVSPLEELHEAADLAAGSAQDAAGSVQAQNTALSAVKGAANSAKGGLDTLRPAVADMEDPLNTVAGAARTLGDNLRSVPKTINIKASTSGIDAAITELGRLASAAAAVKTNIAIKASVQSGTGTTPPTPGVPRATGGAVFAKASYPVGEHGPELFVPNSAGKIYSNRDTQELMEGAGGEPQEITVNQTYNVYNPLAAKILADQRDRDMRNKYAELMNG